MKFKADEIVSVIREEIANYQRQMDVSQVGRVLEVGDGIAQIFGLSGAMAGEMLEFENGEMGQVFNLEEDSIGAVIYGSAEAICEGNTVRTTGRLLSIPAGEEMLGRVIDPLGRPMDGGGPIRTQVMRPVEMIAPGIAGRQPVTEPMLTGVTAIDSMVPIGCGQRELIIGDRKTGKTAIAIDAIINQKDSGVICVYVAIGQKDSTVAGVVETLRAHGAMKHTIVVAASSSVPAPLQYIAPYAGCAIAEHFMYTQGKATLVVYDDLSKQAAAYRQISLLLRRPPGREAYPGDVFYLHSRLLERACKLAEKYVIVPKALSSEATADSGVDKKVYVGPMGIKEAKEAITKLPDAASLTVYRLPTSGGSMTALPICETQEGEVSAYIPTNLISITDGQIYLEPSLFFSGVRPAVNVGISVSRVGYKAAWPAMRKVAASLRLDLAAYRELESFALLSVDLDAATTKQLNRGERMVRLLTQPQYQPQTTVDMVLSIFSGNKGFLDDLPSSEVPFFAQGLREYVKASFRDLYDDITKTRQLSKENEDKLLTVIAGYKSNEYAAARQHRQKLAGAESA